MEENATSTSSLPLTDVRLIVKSANQQFEDQIIHSVPTWTIRQLKAHLTKVYPSNPTVSEQKLIYSGRLLSDELVLKDILRSYKDVETENHIFHLVYTPKISASKPAQPPPVQPQEIPLQKLNQEKPMSQPVASTSADGLRHRNVSSSPTAPVASTSKAALNELRYRSAPSPAAAPVASTSKAALENEARYRNASLPQTPPVASTSKAALAAASKASSTSAQTPQQIPNMANPFIIPQTTGAATAGCPNFPSINLGYPNLMPFGFPVPVNTSMPAEQQAAVYNWVQQVYSNYMEQCLKMADETLNTAQSQPFPANIPLFMPPPQYFAQNIPAPQVATASSATAPRSMPTVDLNGPSTSRAAAAAFAPRVIPVIPKPAQPQPAPAAAPTPVPPPPAPAQPENVEQPQPRFPNIVQEEQENRDWLDSFYSVTRLLALLTLVYVYSSPLRCLMVAIIVVGIYLYHIGFLQTRRLRNNNNNQNVNDNNAPAEPQERDPLNPNPPADPAAGDAGQNAGVGAGAGAGAGAGVGVAASSPANSGSRSDLTSSSVTPPEAEQSSTSLIAFVRTFVVSFFASLLPETPAL